MENNNFKIEASDVILDCFEKMAGGAENLVQYLAQANGKELYNKISESLGVENTTKLYEEDVTAERLLLSTQAVELKRTQEETVPKM